MWLKLLRSSTFRVALVYMVLFGASGSVLLGFIYWATAGYMSRQADATIEVEIQGLAEQYRQRGLEGLSDVMRERVARDPQGSSIYLLAAQDYRALAGNLDRWPLVRRREDDWLDFRLEVPAGANDKPRRARAREFVLRGGLHLLVGREVNELEEVRALVVRALGWGFALTVALAMIGGLAMSRATLRRIDAINQTSREIMRGQLSRRIPTKGTGDDFDQLADNLNAMLDQIERLMDGVRQVSDNVAHDLKTPLARLQHRLEALRGRYSDSEAGELVEKSIAEADRLLATFNALLRIARIESGSRRGAPTVVELSSLVRDVAEFYEPLAEERGQTLALEGLAPAHVAGDRDLLFQAVANVLDNAIKYTPDGGRISLGVQPDSVGAAGDDGWRYPDTQEVEQGFAIQIFDSGTGIPAEDREKVFQRFFRLEGSRGTPGNGLGLSLVVAVVVMHGGFVRLADNRPGLRVSLVLPG